MLFNFRCLENSGVKMLEKITSTWRTTLLQPWAKNTTWFKTAYSPAAWTTQFNCPIMGPLGAEFIFLKVDNLIGQASYNRKRNSPDIMGCILIG